jgi:conjugative transposon TraN protein
MLICLAFSVTNLLESTKSSESFSVRLLTNDGQLYSFIVDYSDYPAQLNIVVKNKNASADSSSSKPVVQTSSINEAVLNQIVRKISEMKVKHMKRDNNYQMQLLLNGIYISRDALYFRLGLRNNSNVSYDADNISFSIRDKQKAKRTATQEIAMVPLYSYGNFDNVESDSSKSCIVALPKFTLPDSKYLSIEVMEKNGGRNLHLTIKNRHIIHAQLMEDSNAYLQF